MSDEQPYKPTLENVERALRYLAETDEEAARAKALLKGMERIEKTVQAQAFLDAKGDTVKEREQKGLTAPPVRDHADKYADAVLDYELLANKRKRAELVIEVWRSLNANQRHGAVV